MTRSTLIAAGVLSALLTGCTTTQPAPVEVSRFYRPELSAAAHGPIAVVAAPGVDGGSIAFRTYAIAVGHELERLGYAQGGDGNLVATIDMQQQVWRGERQPGAVSVGVGGSSGGWHSGVGMGVGLGFNIGGGPKEQVETRLAVTLRDRNGQSLWEGRARYVVPTKSADAQPDAIAAKMAHALFEGFPGKSGETILVK